MNKQNGKDIANFFFELNQLKRQPHIGMQVAGVKHPDTVAEHVFRAAQIAYILAYHEGANPEKAACITLFHDNTETRLGDQNKVNARYYSVKTAEKEALREQIEFMEKKLREMIEHYNNEYSKRDTIEGIVAKDADWLEMAFQAKEYVELGYSAAENWIQNVEKALETKTAKAIIREMKKSSFTDWWQGLKKMTYTKLEDK